MSEIFGIQLGLFILLTFIGGMIIGCVLTARHYRHQIEVKEAEEYGRKDERLRKAPPTDYERFLQHLNAICDNTRVESYEVKAYGETFTFEGAKDE